MGEVEDGIAEDHLQLLVLTGEGASQWIITGLDDNALPGPLPELPLGCPKLRAVMANHPRVTFLLLPLPVLDGHLLVLVSVQTTPMSRSLPFGEEQPELEKYPEKGNLMREAAFVVLRAQI